LKTLAQELVKFKIEGKSLFYGFPKKQKEIAYPCKENICFLRFFNGLLAQLSNRYEIN